MLHTEVNSVWVLYQVLWKHMSSGWLGLAVPEDGTDLRLWLDTHSLG